MLQTLSGIPNVYIRCRRATYRSDHFFRSIPGYLYPKIAELRILFRATENDPVIEPCTVLKQLNSRAKHCGRLLNVLLSYSKQILNILGVDHPQGQGSIVVLPCNVEFTVYLSIERNETPYFIWVSRGTHQHPPPPPTKTPEQYCNEIMKMIEKINEPALTTSKKYPNIL